MSKDKPTSSLDRAISDIEKEYGLDTNTEEEVSIISRSSSNNKNRKEGETDYNRECRYNELRNARRQERLAHPEKYPPTQYWWAPSQPRRCHYFPSDLPTEEEVEFYEQIAYEYLGNGEAYRFHTYDCFLAYNRWSLEELDRWNDYLEFGHVHSLTETLEQWKAHTTDEHHLHKEPPMTPRGWHPDYTDIKEIIKRHEAHLSRINERKVAR